MQASARVPQARDAQSGACEVTGVGLRVLRGCSVAHDCITWDVVLYRGVLSVFVHAEGSTAPVYIFFWGGGGITLTVTTRVPPSSSQLS